MHLPRYGPPGVTRDQERNGCSLCLSPAGYAWCIPGRIFGLTQLNQGVLGLSQTLVMSGPPMLGWNAMADEPTLCTRALE